MRGRMEEIPHNSPEQVREYLVSALALTDDLDPPDDLRPLVFKCAVDLYSAKQLIMEQIAPGLPPNMVVPRGL